MTKTYGNTQFEITMQLHNSKVVVHKLRSITFTKSKELGAPFKAPKPNKITKRIMCYDGSFESRESFAVDGQVYDVMIKNREDGVRIKLIHFEVVKMGRDGNYKFVAQAFEGII